MTDPPDETQAPGATPDADTGEGFFRELFATSLDAILAIDVASGRVALANSAAHRLLAGDGDSLIGRAFASLFPPVGHLSVAELTAAIDVHDGVFTQQFRDGQGETRPMDLTATMFAVDGGNLIAVTLRDVRERVEAERERERLLTELQDALAKVRTLSGLLPICAACKRVRDDQGYWTQIEEYVRDHSEADFSHGFCPSCAEKYFPSESSPEAAD